MDSSVVTVKGQIVIPAPIRKHLGIHKGTKVTIEEKDGDIILHPITKAFLDKWQGAFSGIDLVGELMKSRREDREREDRKFSS